MRVMQIMTILFMFKYINSLNTPKYIRSLARDNYKLVHYFAKPYLNKYSTLDKNERNELIQEGYDYHIVVHSLNLVFSRKKY